MRRACPRCTHEWEGDAGEITPTHKRQHPATATVTPWCMGSCQPSVCALCCDEPIDNSGPGSVAPSLIQPCEECGVTRIDSRL